MSQGNDQDRQGQTPTQFMRKLRPELYSDSKSKTSYELDKQAFEYTLSSLTARNEHQAFELFCRKLCERTICPNLRPATGPEGGGDAKVDSDSVPVAEEIAERTYIGEPSTASEWCAFAFSAKEKWQTKARSDAASAMETNRGYTRFYFVTSQYARAKDRAALEDELTRKHQVSVTILDRSWIVDHVIEKGCRDLAVRYLNVGKEFDERQLGPKDYARQQQLEEIEDALSDSARFAGVEWQLASEALIAAKLSRELERPRHETDGRFLRAMRLSQKYGTHFQSLEAEYESIWTAFWWFDDFATVLAAYEGFECKVIGSTHAKELEFLGNLLQLHFNAVINCQRTAEDVDLDARVARLTDRLTTLAIDPTRPNNALAARVLLLCLRVNIAVLARDAVALSESWIEFVDVLEAAEGLGEFDAERLDTIIGVFGQIAGTDPAYAKLVDRLAEFMGKRTSETRAALVLLRRAKQLPGDGHLEMIRVLGSAVYRLSKKEHNDAFIEATQQLALAYLNAGLLWAARSCAWLALATTVIETEEHPDPAAVIPALMVLAWIALELNYLPEVFQALLVARGAVASANLTEDSKAHFLQQLKEFDISLSCVMVNLDADELARLGSLPEVFESLELHSTRSWLLYAMGHETQLREEGVIPESKSADSVRALGVRLAAQLTIENRRRPLIVNSEGDEARETRVLGARIRVLHPGSVSAVLGAEALITAIEVVFATMLEAQAIAHTEYFEISLSEDDGVAAPVFVLHRDESRGEVRWPRGRTPSELAQQSGVVPFLVETAISVLLTTCFARDMTLAVKQLLKDDALLQRLSVSIHTGNCIQRVLREPVQRISAWTKKEATVYAVLATRPVLVEHDGHDSKRGEASMPEAPSESPNLFRDHRKQETVSVINMHLWDRAGWQGIGYAMSGEIPCMTLLFRDEGAAWAIFNRWRERFGPMDENERLHLALVREIAGLPATHYRALVTSAPNDRGSSWQAVVTRSLTVEPSSSQSLDFFREAYRRIGRYLLAPAAMVGGGPKIGFDMGIQKRAINIKRAAEVGVNDIEYVLLAARVERPRE